MQMGFSEAVQSCMSKYAEFNGRASRAEYWLFVLFIAVVTVLLAFVSGALCGLFQLATLLPWVAASSRRLHDTGRSGWWQLIGLLPVIGLIVIIVFLAQPGQDGENAHGPKPVDPAPAA
jgi:uncharacterized membrane protein YhaH (DUF805 family)